MSIPHEIPTQDFLWNYGFNTLFRIANEHDAERIFEGQIQAQCYLPLLPARGGKGEMGFESWRLVGAELVAVSADSARSE